MDFRRRQALSLIDGQSSRVKHFSQRHQARSYSLSMTRRHHLRVYFKLYPSIDQPPVILK